MARLAGHTIFNTVVAPGVSSFDYRNPAVETENDRAKFDPMNSFDRAVLRDGTIHKTFEEANSAAKTQTIAASRLYVPVQHVKTGLWLCVPKDLADRMVIARNVNVEQYNNLTNSRLSNGGPGSGPRKSLNEYLETTNKWNAVNPISKDDHARLAKENSDLSKRLNDKGFHETGQVQHAIAKYHEARGEHGMTHEKASEFAHDNMFDKK